MTVEIHGKIGCPFAWRARIAARLKGVAYEWLPLDAATPDPRSAQHNPDKKSPLLWEDGFTLVESLVIAQYFDEAHASSTSSASLMPKDARERAQTRLAVAELEKLLIPHDDGHAAVSPETKAKLDGALASLDKRLADGRAFLGGDAPGLADVSAWPSLALIAAAHVSLPERVRVYWDHARAHDAFTFTKPPWA